jgi:arylsulfatase A-like enzyme
MSNPNRRDVLSAAAAVAAATSVVDAAMAADPARKRPNILWLVSEDNNPFIGAYGDTLAHTPVLDALAKEGILYRNVFTNAPVCAPTRFSIITGVHPESAGPAHNMRAVAKLPALVRGLPQYLRDVGYYCTNNAKTDYNSDLDPAAIWNESSRTAHWKNRQEGQPFFAVFNHETTHESRIFQPLKGRVQPQNIRLPAYLPDTPGIRQDFATYYNLMEKMDGEIGAKLAELDAAGLAEDTIVFYYSDNGGVLPRSKRYCYDEGHRCAMIVRVPAKWQRLATGRPGSVVEAPVSYIDLAPTILSLAEIEAPAHMQGTAFLGRYGKSPKRYAFGMRNRMDERYDMVRTVTDGRYRYIRNYSPHRPWGQHGAFQWNARGYQEWEAAHIAGTLNPAQERFWQKKPFEEFYDLASDPDQIDNRISAPEHASRIGAMRRALDAHMVEVNDNGFIPEGSAIEGYDESRRRGAYPLAQAMALAAIAAKGDAANRAYLADHLTGPNEVLRYWAAIGLLVLGDAARPSLNALQRMMKEDSAPQVRIVAAEAVANLTDDADAVATLSGLLDAHSHPRVRLQAVNALTYIGDKARPARAAIERAALTDDEYLSTAGRYLGFVLDGSYTPQSPVLDFDAFMKRMAKQPKING